jgi:hypothetical protein
VTGEIQALIARGREEGELTYDEIIEALPEAIIDIDAIEKVIESLVAAGIEVIRPDDPLQERLAKTLEDEGLSWIVKSSLTERAYWIGAQRAAKLLGASKKTGAGFIKPILKTSHHRSADDTFPFTRLGRILADLVKAIQCEHKSPEAMHGHVDSLNVTLEDLASAWQRELRDSKGLIQDFLRLIEVVREARTPDSKRELLTSVNTLNQPLRRLSLLETSHDIQDRFDQAQTK